LTFDFEDLEPMLQSGDQAMLVGGNLVGSTFSMGSGVLSILDISQAM
jgi:hypothetical protein